MPEYKKTADGDWIPRRNWSTVRAELQELRGDGADWRAFRVRTNPQEGDESRADAHPETQALFRPRADTSQSPRRHAPPGESTTAAQEPPRVEEAALDLDDLVARRFKVGNRSPTRARADSDDIHTAEETDAHGGAGHRGLDVGDDRGEEYDDGVGTGANRLTEHTAAPPRAYDDDGGVGPEVVAPAQDRWYRGTAPRAAAGQHREYRYDDGVRPEVVVTHPRVDDVGWRVWAVALVVCVGVLYAAYAALMFLAGLLGFRSGPPDVSTSVGDDISPAVTTVSRAGGHVSSAAGDGRLGVDDAGEDVSSDDDGVSVPESAERRLGLDGAARRRVQTALAAEGFDPGPVDGDFGPGTREALRAWQRAHDLDITGYLDREAAERLSAFAPSGRPAPRRTAVDAGGAAGTLTVRGDPSSSIEIDGAVIGVVPASGVVVVPDVRPGEHVVVARREGYLPVTSVVEVAGDRAAVVNVTAEGTPGRLTVSANVTGAVLRIGDAEARSLPVADLQIPPGAHGLVVSREGYAPIADRVDVSPGQLVSRDFILEAIPREERVRAALAPAEAHFRARDYRAAVAALRSVLDVVGDSPRANWMLGAGLFELGEFPESVTPLARAIALGTDVVLPAKHRHGGGGFREGFCEGTLTLSLTEIAFASFDAPDHGFSVAPDKVAEPAITESVGGFPFRLNTSVRDPERGIERNNFDFVHRNAARQAAPEESLRLIVLGCPDCDASLHVQEALMTILIRSANR